MASRNKGRKTSSWKKRLLLHPCRNVIKVKETWGNKSFELWYSFLQSWWKETMKGQTILILLPEVSRSCCCQCPSVVHLAQAGLHQPRNGLTEGWMHSCLTSLRCCQAQGSPSPSDQEEIPAVEGARFCGLYIPNLAGTECLFLFQSHCPSLLPSLPLLLQHSQGSGKRCRAHGSEIKCGIPAWWETTGIHSSMGRISPKAPILHTDGWNYLQFLGFCHVLNQLGTKG